jgi:hypothetical protein
MVVFINQGEPGKPAFTGKDSPDTCFYVKAIYRGETKSQIFEGDGFHVPHHPHKFLVHQTALMDFDGDGLFDILLNEGMIDIKKRRGQWYLHNIGKQSLPEFRAYYLHESDELEDLPSGSNNQALKMFLTPLLILAYSLFPWSTGTVMGLMTCNTQALLRT